MSQSALATAQNDEKARRKLTGQLGTSKTLEEVRECHHLTGGDDFLLKVTTTNLAALEALIEALLSYGNPVTSLVLSSPPTSVGWRRRPRWSPPR